MDIVSTPRLNTFMYMKADIYDGLGKDFADGVEYTRIGDGIRSLLTTKFLMFCRVQPRILATSVNPTKSGVAMGVQS